MCPAIKATGKAYEYVYKILLSSQKNAINVKIIVSEGTFGEDKVEDETLDKIFPKSRMRRGEGFFPFPRPYWWQDKEFLGILVFF